MTRPERIKILLYKNNVNYSLYKCACGKEFEAWNSNVISGRTKSCGCLFNSTHLKGNKNDLSRQKFLFNGDTFSLTELSKKCGIKKGTLRSRIKFLGWSIEKAVNTPSLKKVGISPNFVSENKLEEFR
jgi:hypothetical protein